MFELVHLASMTLAAPSSDGPAKPVWIDIAQLGAFRGHASGAFAITS